ncbi:drug resistance transporter, EmrB/QacA subfamily [Actinacidiphila yanglinensis]|uniref:Drug resistance transporter, EmrB/QacA subfamily n=1 Tax=Actinacidiphila yanglinensis TaxID=310779 RepID=A0A1H6EA21_9ACTN|nr:MFS transporter [Actinacidiphila yanglinensis]SEG94121.1 drug resistance transporter, EmrB/QacA subfamily [Actinacidiphila yanglinensis]
MSTPSASTTGGAVADPRRFRALGVIVLAQLMIVLDASIVTVAVPSAQASLHISVADRQWVFTAYTLAFGGLLLLGGRIADFVGRKRIFEIGLVGFAAASAVGGFAQNAATLFGARALQGGFAALLAPAALSLLTVTFTNPKEQARAFGIYGAVSGGAMSIGLIMGGMLTQWASWRWTMLVNVPIALVALVGSRWAVTESKAKGEAHYDLLGAATVTAGLVALVYGSTKAESDGWTSGVTLSLLAVGVILLAAFVAVEARTEHPLLPLRVLADRTRGGAFLANLLTIAGMFATFLLLTYYLQGVLGYSALKTGLAYLPYSVGTFVGATVAAKLMGRIGARNLLVGSMVLGAVGLVLFAQVGTHTSFASHVLPAEIITSLGLGLAFVPLTSAALVGVDPADAGVASALVNTTQQVGNALGVALLNTIAATATASYIAGHGASAAVRSAGLVHGYRTAFIIGAAFLGVSALVTLILVRTRRQDMTPGGGQEVLTELAEVI